MGAFEHIVVLLSFVYALAIAHLLLTVAALIRSSSRVRFSWLHGFWMLNALMVLVADWISTWDLHALPNWNMDAILFLLTLSFIDYLQAALVCPEIPPQGPIDLPRFHAEQSRRYIGAFAVSALMGILANTIFGGVYDLGQLMQENLTTVPLLLLAICAAAFRARWVQITVPIGIGAGWIYYFTALQGSLH